MFRPLTTFGYRGIGFLFQTGKTSAVFSGIRQVEIIETESEFFIPYYEEGASTENFDEGGTESSSINPLHDYIDHLTLGGTTGVPLVETDSEVIGVHQYISSLILGPELLETDKGFFEVESHEYISSEVLKNLLLVTTGFLDDDPKPIFFASNSEEFDDIPIAPLLVQSKSDMYFSPDGKVFSWRDWPAYIEAKTTLLTESDSQMHAPGYFAQVNFPLGDSPFTQNDSLVFTPAFLTPETFAVPLLESWSDRWADPAPGNFPLRFPLPSEPFEPRPDGWLVGIINAEYIEGTILRQVGFVESYSEALPLLGSGIGFISEGFHPKIIETQSEVFFSGGNPEFVEGASGPTEQTILDTSPTYWFSGDEIQGLNDGESITTWPDKTTNGNDASAAVGFEPVFRINAINSLPGAEFAFSGGGNPDVLETNILSGWTENYTLAVVFKASDVGSGILARHRHDSDGSAVFHRGSIDLGVNGGRGFFGDDVNFAGFDGRNAGAFNTGQGYLLIHRKRTGQPVADIWRDGVSVTPVDSGGSATSALGANRRAEIGINSNSHITEVLLWQRDLTQQEIDDVNAFFKDKYGIS